MKKRLIYQSLFSCPKVFRNSRKTSWSVSKSRVRNCLDSSMRMPWENGGAKGQGRNRRRSIRWKASRGSLPMCSMSFCSVCRSSIRSTAAFHSKVFSLKKSFWACSKIESACRKKQRFIFVAGSWQGNSDRRDGFSLKECWVSAMTWWTSSCSATKSICAVRRKNKER